MLENLGLNLPLLLLLLLQAYVSLFLSLYQTLIAGTSSSMLFVPYRIASVSGVENQLLCFRLQDYSVDLNELNQRQMSPILFVLFVSMGLKALK